MLCFLLKGFGVKEIGVFLFLWSFSGASPLAATVAASFSILKLLCLVGWFFLCFYLVQRIQFSYLVPKKLRTLTNVGMLILGPILFGILFGVDLFRKSWHSDRGFIAVIKEQILSLRSPKAIMRRKMVSISLFDSAGVELKEIYGQGKTERRDVLDLTERIILSALESDASDILIDPRDRLKFTVRFRIDGVLRPVDELDSDTCKAMINSIKVLSGMDIAEKRRPQDGAFRAQARDKTFSFRVASAGVRSGEKLSVRVLNQKAGEYTLALLGVPEKQAKILRQAIKKPTGMILISDPTGSGKTTTLYAMLNEIDLYERNVITIEDPIEYTLPNASQIEINPKADITFAKSLRSVLRQDPDIICVGEIRDSETASIALQAAQTGHLVLATVHSNSNASSLIRLLDLGVSPLLLTSGLSVMISQRLVRCLCDDCKRPASLNDTQIVELKKKKINYKNIYEAAGCTICGGTGYKGRTAVCDIMELDDEMKANIANNEVLVSELRKDGDKKDISKLYKQGMRKVLSGITSFRELKRVVG